ncbi:MAG: family oxidoreductase, partial [Labilithrix sp.]|nr:family oxidoreductase [Labilithrix sp.]
RLARRGFDLILVARTEERLQRVAKDVIDGTGRAVQIVRADLVEPEDRTRVETILRTDPNITMLVNNAGFGAVTPLLASNVETMSSMIALNVEALTRLTYAAVPGFVARGRGAIVNISSIVAIGPEILNGVYGATKAYVLAFSQSLQHEVASKGVRIQAVLPGGTATEFWDVAGLPHANLPKGSVMRTEDMVDAALVGFDRGEVVTIPPLQNGDDWSSYESTRRALSQKFGHATPGPRYLENQKRA